MSKVNEQTQLIPPQQDIDRASKSSSGDGSSRKRGGKLLQRAASLVKPSGAPTAAVRSVLQSQEQKEETPPLRRRLTEDFSGKLKGIFKTGKEKGGLLTRSKTSKKDKTKDGDDKKSRHGRSHSESVLSGASKTRPSLAIQVNNDSTIPEALHTSPAVLSTPMTPLLREGRSDPTASVIPVSPTSHQAMDASSEQSRSIAAQNLAVPEPPSASGSAQPSAAEASTDPALANATDDDDVKVPALLLQGTPLLKISNKGQKNRMFRLDPDQGRILWPSKKAGIITIENIREMRSGANARTYREQFKIADNCERRWLTIVYLSDGQYKTLHVVAFTDDVFKMWETTLDKMYSLRQELMSGLGNIERRQKMWEKQYWKGADSSGDDKLEFKEVEKMCRRLNIHTAREDLLRKFKEADVGSKGYLTFADFQKFVKLLKARPEVLRLYNKYKETSPTFDYSAFEKFMREGQKSDMSQSQLIRIFSKYSRAPGSPSSSPTSAAPDALPKADNSQSPKSEGVPVQTEAPPSATPSTPPQIPTGAISLDAFTSFLISADNSPFVDQHGKIYHDMSRPLADYYISSSHNTYLVGHQLVGDSTIEGYIRALLQGCRSVELDIWDGDSEPKIYHGRTLTSKVSLREVVKAIAKYAFVASPFPVIISAEVHCNLEQQDMIAVIMKEEFGDMLVTDYLPEREQDREKGVLELPSPEELKGRILLKAKNLFVAENISMQSKSVVLDAESSSTETSASSSDADGVGSTLARGFVNQVRRRAPKIMGGGTPSSPPTTSTIAVGQNEHVKIRMSFALVSLLIYTVGVKCRGFNKKENYQVTHLFSLSERTANKIIKQSMVDLIKHTRTHAVRIYPNGTRLNSTNFEPHRYWAAGAQLVALNWQTFDLGYMINYAMFQRNGRSGFVLKPAALRLKEAKESLGKRTEHFLDVTIISAQQLPRPKDAAGHEIVNKSIVDPFVEVSVHIPDWSHSPFIPDADAVNYSPATNAHKHAAAATNVAAAGMAGNTGSASSARTVSARTDVVKNNGFNPVWEKKLSIPFDLMGDMKDLVFVRFEVKEEDREEDQPVGVYCMSLGSLNMGYRHLPLHDRQMSQYLFSTLFVKINVRDVATK